MTNLQEINGINKYCGPAVLAALTGRTTDECAAVISYVSGKREIKAVQLDHLIAAFKRLNFDCVKQNPRGYTLFSCLSSLSSEPGFYIILVPRHVVAIEVNEFKQIYFIDNHTKHPINASSSARLSQKAEYVFKIIPKPKVVVVNNDRTFKLIRRILTVETIEVVAQSRQLAIQKAEDDIDCKILKEHDDGYEIDHHSIIEVVKV